MTKHNIANLERVAAAVKSSHSTLATIKASAEIVDFYLAYNPDTAQALLRALREARAAALEMLQMYLDDYGHGDASEWNAQLEEELGWGENSQMVKIGRAIANLDANFDFTEEE